MPAESLKSKVYTGNIRHRRFTPRDHSFNYSLYMLALDVDEIGQSLAPQGIFGYQWFRPLRFVEKDYLESEPGTLKQRITNKVKQLGGSHNIERVVMLVQARCFGVYFSPANFYFCYDDQDCCVQMLAEVSNTPWNERHYYLVDLINTQSSEKDFHVSPFMDLNMHYHWRIKPPEQMSDKLLIHIENKRHSEDNNTEEKIFDATLTMKKQGFTQKELWHVWSTLPVMTIKMVAGIYWQALKLFIKRIPFIGHQSSAN